MREVWREFRSFAMGGNLIDLALGFIIGAAFAKLIEAFAQFIVMDSVAVLFGQPDFTSLNIEIGRSKIELGAFLSQLLSFLLLAWVLFVLVKAISAFGLGQRRSFELRECPFCLEYVAARALICKHCRQPLVDELPSLQEAEQRNAELRVRRLPLPIPVRRRAGAARRGRVRRAPTRAATSSAVGVPRTTRNSGASDMPLSIRCRALHPGRRWVMSNGVGPELSRRPAVPSGEPARVRWHGPGLAGLRRGAPS